METKKSYTEQEIWKKRNDGRYADEAGRFFKDTLNQSGFRRKNAGIYDIFSLKSTLISISFMLQKRMSFLIGGKGESCAMDKKSESRIVCPAVLEVLRKTNDRRMNAIKDMLFPSFLTEISHIRVIFCRKPD